MFAVAMLVVAGFAAGMALSVRNSPAVDRRVVWTLWAAAAVALVIAALALAL